MCFTHWSEDGKFCSSCGEPTPEKEVGKAMKKNKTLAVYLTNGGVAYFENVRDFVVNDVAIGYKYSDIQSEVEREAYFFNANITGFTLEIDEESEEGKNAKTK